MNEEILIYPFKTMKLVDKDLIFSKTYIFMIKENRGLPVTVSSNLEVNCKSRQDTFAGTSFSEGSCWAEVFYH